MCQQIISASFNDILDLNIKKSKQAVVEVIFGLSSKNCTGVGICRIDVHYKRDDNPVSLGCQGFIAELSFEKNQLLLKIGIQTICKRITHKLFSGTYVPIPEAFRLAPSLVEAWALPVQAILPGQYAQVRTCTHVTIIFPI